MNAQTESFNTARPIGPAFVTGFGQSDTHAATLNDGRQNPHKSASTPYGTITAREIVAMVRTPPSVPKERAQWFIPSAYHGCDARTHEVQRERGLFYWLTLDVDDNNLTLAEVNDAVDAVTGASARLIYSSRSARPDRKKWRALVPLRASLGGADFADAQHAFYDLLERASAGVLLPDRRLALPAQLVYLPNRGEFYEHHIVKADRLDLTEDHPIVRRMAENRAARAQAEAEAQARRQFRSATRPAPSGDGVRPVDHFNASHSVADLLARYGYRQLGHSADWRSPMQTSGSYATRDCGDYWVSLSASDAAAGIGAASANGNRHGDAFDLFAHFEHGGDFNAAVAAYAHEAGLTRRPDTRSTAGNAQTAGAGHGGGPDLSNDADTQDLSHDALALDMERQGWGQDARHVATWGKWLFWDGARWRIDDRLEAMTRTREHLRHRAAAVIDWAERKAEKQEMGKDGDKLIAWAKDQAKTLRNKATVAAVESLAQSNAALVARAGDFDSKPMLLGTPGGTVDLRTGKMRPAMRADMLTRLTSVTPAGGVPARWLRFLAEIFDGDADLIAFMQRAAGYALTGETREHKLLFLYGTGRNGKSVFLNTLFHIWGEYARRASAATFLNSTGDKHPTDLAGLQGARLVVGSELPKGKTWDESTIKDLTGGDVITARYMRGDFFDFEPQLTLFIAGNNMPSFRGVDEAIRARVVLVPFTVTIPPERRDKHLADKLKDEAPQILQWAIEGALQWQARGLDVPASVAAASADYFDDEDTLGQFLQDETATMPGHFVSAQELHQRFVQWCEGQGLSAWTQLTLVKEMASRGFERAKSNGRRGLKGLKLT